MIDSRGEGLAGKDLVNGICPTAVAVEVDPGGQTTRSVGGNVDVCHRADVERAGKGHTVLVVRA